MTHTRIFYNRFAPPPMQTAGCAGRVLEISSNDTKNAHRSHPPGGDASRRGGWQNGLEEFDYESANKRQLKGNIYLAKITRVEPSLQAAFVDYGGNRHGFLAFSEIHPDYYPHSRSPIARPCWPSMRRWRPADAASDNDEEDLAVNARADLVASTAETTDSVGSRPTS